MGMIVAISPAYYANAYKTTRKASPHLADPHELFGFLTLAKEYIDEQGGEVLWGPKTEAFHRLFFEVGTVALCTDGFSAAGMEYPQDTPWGGKVAVGLGTYVRPTARRKGLATKLRKLVLNKLAADGFTAVMGMTHTGNTAGIASIQTIDNWRWHPLGQNGVLLLEG